MDTSFHSWNVSQGSLSIIQEAQGYGLYLKTQKDTVRIEEGYIEYEGDPIDFVNMAGKTSEFFMAYFPIITHSKNIYSVVFYEMNVIDFQPTQGVNKTLNFNSLQTKILLSFSPTAPAYRRVIPGLNLEGQCSTAGCEAYGKIVYVPIGMSGPDQDKRYQIPRLVYEKAICPACQDPLPPDSVTNLGFWKCQYTIDGRLDSPTIANPDRVVKETVVVEDKKFTTFKSGEHKTWVFLDISTQSASGAAMRAARSSKSPGGSNKPQGSSGCVLF